MAAPVVTPNSVAALRSDQTLQFSANQAVTWASSDGAISSGGLFTPPKKTGTYLITATNGSSESTIVTVPVIAVFDWDINTPVTEKFRKESRIFIPRSGPKDRQTRIDVETIQQIEIDLTWYSVTEQDEILDFYRNHHPHKDFYFFDYQKNQMWKAWIPSELGRERRRGTGNYSFTIERLGWEVVVAPQDLLFSGQNVTFGGQNVVF